MVLRLVIRNLLIIPVFLLSIFSFQVSFAELVDESLSDKIFMDGRIITSRGETRLIKYKNKLYVCWYDTDIPLRVDEPEFQKSKLITYCFDKN